MKLTKEDYKSIVDFCDKNNSKLSGNDIDGLLQNARLSGATIEFIPKIVQFLFGNLGLGQDIFNYRFTTVPAGAFWDYQFPSEAKDSVFLVPKTVKAVGEAMFLGSDIDRVLFDPDPLVNPLPKKTFKDSAVREVELGAGINGIDTEAFAGCKNLTTVVLKTTGQKVVILDHAFANCSELTYLSIPDSVIELHIKANAFEGCDPNKLLIKVSPKALLNNASNIEGLNFDLEDGESAINDFWNEVFDFDDDDDDEDSAEQQVDDSVANVNNVEESESEAEEE